MLDLAQRTAFNEDHDQFRDTVRKLFDRELIPHLDSYEQEGIVDRKFWRACGEAGLLCPTVTEEYGGLGLDFGYNAVVDEELGYVGFGGGHHAAERHRRRLYRGLWLGGAEAQMAARHGVGRDRSPRSR